MTSNYDNYLELLQKFALIPKTCKSESLFEIAGYPHYENVCSNILAFYLNPSNEHGLGNLVFSSLMSLADGDESQQSNFQINREVSTNKGGRLDIVIETDNQIIGIENKIFQHLYNDLADYKSSVEEWSERNKLTPINIVLSIRKEHNRLGFVCVTYKQLWAKIRERLGDYISTSSQKWLLYLVDFMSSIDQYNGGNMELDKADKFIIDNEVQVNALLEARNKLVSKLHDKVVDLLNMTAKPPACENQWIYAKSCLVHDFILSGHSIAINASISSKGWELNLIDRKDKSLAYLKKLISTPPISKHEFTLENSRYIFQHYDLSAKNEDINKDLIMLVNELIIADKVINDNKGVLASINSSTAD